MKLDIKIAQQIAEKNGGKCLSEKYTNNKTNMLWECKVRHRWMATLSNVKQKSWCPICATNNKKLDGLKIANQLAKQNNGRCLSTEYIDCKTQMEWGCKNNHRWNASLGSIKECNTWCPYCAGLRFDDGIKLANDIAKQYNGKCLSKKYINSETKLVWQCKFGHDWEATLHGIKIDKTWCPYCAGKKITIQDCNKIAEDHNGKCLSNEYINITTKMRWECVDGHRWLARLNGVKNNGNWCPECANIKRSMSSNKCYELYHWKTNKKIVCIASWEKLVVEYLNKNLINFKWQSKTFKMPDGKTYRPDLYIPSLKKWIEIKGYFRDDAREKWEWFHSTYINSELWDKRKLIEMGILL